jgi:hypothetical protein
MRVLQLLAMQFLSIRPKALMKMQMKLCLIHALPGSWQPIPATMATSIYFRFISMVIDTPIVTTQVFGKYK